jgi:beta-phosphoglucomutase-like phosphatase (HAD superfamily)
MNGQAITFDFHNTLAACPEWFELEVKTLPSAFLGWWVALRGAAVDIASFDDADCQYRELRRDIMEHGNELTAEACLEQVFAEMHLAISGDDILEWTLESFGLRDALQVVITSASAGFYKSRPEIFLHAAAALSADPRRTVHVGDSLRYDVGGASRVGMGTVWLRRDDARRSDDPYTPDLTLETLESSSPRILDILRSRQPAPASHD